MNVLMLSKSGDGLGIAHRLVMDGNSVKMFIQDTRYAWAGKGLVERVTSWRPHLPWSDLIVADMVGFGNYEETLRKLAKPYIGVSAMADMIELDRKKGIELFKKTGIDIPPTFYFDSPEEAKDILSMWTGDGYVLKPHGNIETSKTYVCKDQETYKYALSTYDEGQELTVQELVEGVEISTEGWFNGRDWITPFNHTFEEKRLFNGGIGPNTGCQGNVVVTTSANRLIEATLLKLTPFLRDIGYKGPFDVNCIVNETSVYALEATPRFGYDALEAICEGLKEPILDLLFETAMGIKKEMNITSDPMIAVRVSLPPWPGAEPEEEDRGKPILGLTPQAMKHIYLTDVYKDEDDYLYAAGDGVIYKATAIGRDLKEAKRRVYRTIEFIGAMDKQYRTDIGDRVPGDLKQLIGWGWLNNEWRWVNA